MPESVTELLAALRQEDWDLQWHAADALGDIGPDAAPAVDALIAVMLKTGGHVPGAAARALARIGAASVPALARQLQSDPRPARTDWILDALSGLGPAAAEALPQVRSLLGDSDPIVRAWAAIAYAEIDPTSPDSLDGLVAALDVGDLAIQTRAALRFGRMEQIALPVVSQVFDHFLLAVQVPISKPDSPEGKPRTQEEESAIVNRLVTLAMAVTRIDHRTELLKFVVLGLKHYDPYWAAYAADTLATLGPAARSKLPDLEPLRTHRDAAVRLAADRAIRLINA